MTIVAGLTLFALAGRANDVAPTSPNDPLEVYEADDKVRDEDALYARFRRQGWVSIGPYRLTAGRLDGRTVREAHFEQWAPAARKPHAVGKAKEMEFRFLWGDGKLILFVHLKEAEIELEDGTRLYLADRSVELPLT
jgi:hypothetical protein